MCTKVSTIFVYSANWCKIEQDKNLSASRKADRRLRNTIAGMDGRGKDGR